MIFFTPVAPEKPIAIMKKKNVPTRQGISVFQITAIAALLENAPRKSKITLNHAMPAICQKQTIHLLIKYSILSIISLYLFLHLQLLFFIAGIIFSAAISVLLRFLPVEYSYK